MWLLERIYLVGCIAIWIYFSHTTELNATETNFNRKDILSCSYRSLCNETLFREADIKCGCDPSCHKYNTCCRDVYDPTLTPSQTFECFRIGDSSTYVTTRCPQSYNVTEVRDFCVTPPFWTVSPLPNQKEWFVSSNKTGYLYKNIYCAICNGEDPGNMKYLQRELSCREVRQKMKYTVEGEGDKRAVNSSAIGSGFGKCVGSWEPINYSPKCKRMVSLCPVTITNNSLTHECHHGPMEVVKDRAGNWYRNDACMKCNGVFQSGLCRNDLPESEIVVPPDMNSLRILVRPAGDTCWSPNAGEFSLSEDDVCKVKQCADGEIIDWLTRACQPLCPSPLRWMKGKCQRTACSVIEIESFLNIYKANKSSLNFTSHSVELVTESGERFCYPCHWHKLLSEEVQVNISHLKVKETGLVYSYPMFTLFEEGKHQICETDMCMENAVNRSTFLDSYMFNQTIDYTEKGLEMTSHRNSSICYLCAWKDIHRETVRIERNVLYVVINHLDFKIMNPFYYFVNETLVKVCSSELSPLDHFKASSSCDKLSDPIVSISTITVSIVSLAVMIMIYILLPELHNVAGFLALSQAASLLLGYIFFLLRSPSATDRAGCYATAVLTHYLFLTSYFWSFLFAVEVFQSTKPFHRINSKSMKRLCQYSAIGWMVPFLPPLVAIILDHKIDTRFYDVKDLCWLSSPNGLYYCFIIPMAVIFALNTIFYVVIITRFAVLAYKSRGVNIHHKEKVILSLKLVVAFGLLWIFGLLAAFTWDDTLTCIFTFTNGLSGLALMVVFLCNKSTYKSLTDFIRNKVKKVETTGSSTDKSTESSSLNGNLIEHGSSCLEESKIPLTAISKSDPMT